METTDSLVLLDFTFLSPSPSTSLIPVGSALKKDTSFPLTHSELSQKVWEPEWSPSAESYRGTKPAAVHSYNSSGVRNPDVICAGPVGSQGMAEVCHRTQVDWRLLSTLTLGPNVSGAGCLD